MLSKNEVDIEAGAISDGLEDLRMSLEEALECLDKLEMRLSNLSMRENLYAVNTLLVTPKFSMIDYMQPAENNIKDVIEDAMRVCSFICFERELKNKRGGMQKEGEE